MDGSRSQTKTAVRKAAQFIEWDNTEDERNMFHHQDKTLMDRNEASKYLRISTRHLYRLTVSNKIKHIRFGKSLRYEKADIDRFIDSHKIS